MKCAVCMDKSPKYLIQECRHYCVCKNCKMCVEKRAKKCPISTCGIEVKTELVKVKRNRKFIEFLFHLVLGLIFNYTAHRPNTNILSFFG